jgi:FG-GAP repeat
MMSMRVSILIATACLSLATSSALPAQVLVWDRVSPPALQQSFGFTLWPISDVNGDQVKDLLIGSYSSYVGVLSGATGSTIVELFAPPALNLSPLGPVGDTTGDGMIDFMILSFPQGFAITQLISGSDGSVVANLQGSNWTPYPIGNVNGDGYGDFAMATPQIHGSVSVYQGPGFNFAYALYAQWAYSRFGHSVAPCGDINGDNVPDFIVGAPGNVNNWEPPAVVPGFAYVFSGSNGAMIHNWTGPFVGSHFGAAVVSPGDVNGDGVPDIVVSAPGLGAVTLSVFSGATGAQIGSFTDPFGYFDWFGTVLRPLGDVDGDAVGDFAALGAWVDVFSGATTTPIYHITTNLVAGPPPGLYPRMFAGLEDFDGDDFPEIVIGVPPSGTPSPPGHIQCYTLRPGGVSVNGNGCPQSGGAVARIGATGVAQSGSTFPITLSNVSPGLAAGLMVGLSNTQWGSVTLPWMIDPALVPGCFLYTSIDWFFPTTTTSAGSGLGRAILPLSIPPAAAGLTFHAQWGIVNPPGSSTLGSVTRALGVTIQ